MLIMTQWLRWILLLVFCTMCNVAFAQITGAGSSLAYPVMRDLTAQYRSLKKIDVDYKSIGSGQGIVQMAARTVDFSLSDIPLTQFELDTQNLVQFPVFASAIVPVCNLPGSNQTKVTLSDAILTDIYLGRITQWNDPVIEQINPGLSLPAIPIKVIYRSDISGSSYVFTRYLAKSSQYWNDHYGIGSKIKWPVGDGVKGGAAVEQAVKNTEGAIAYLEYGAALNSALSTVDLLVNGKKITASEASIGNTFSKLEAVPPSFYQFKASVTNPDEWPIIAITYALVSKKPNADEESVDSLNFFNWVYQSGASTLKQFHLLPIENKKTMALIEAQWKTITTLKGTKVWVTGGERP